MIDPVGATGQNVAADLAVQATEMSTDERKRARKYSTSVVNGLHELASGSDGVHKALSKCEMRYRHNGDESNIDEDHHMYVISPLLRFQFAWV